MKKYHSFKPGHPWYDTEGKPIQAHAGYMMYLDHKFYWYGENKEGVTDEKVIWHNGVRLYSSDDLYNWKDEGVICVSADPQSPLYPTSRMDRPHILFNKKTGKFVMWMKIMAPDKQHMVVACADKITGPFQIVNNMISPGGMSSGDFDLYKDENGKGYLVFERVHSEMIAMALTDDYLDTTVEYSTHLPKPYPPFVREAPAIFKRGDYHYVITSGTTAKFPNPSEAARFQNIHGQWEELGLTHVDDKLNSSFDSQISCVFKHPHIEDLYIAMADRWLVDLPTEGRYDIVKVYEARFNPADQTGLGDTDLYTMTAKNTSLATYVWLPIKFVDGIPKLEWRDEWRLEDYATE